MIVTFVLLGLGWIAWGALQVLLAGSVERAPLPDGDFRVAHRQNLAALLVGLSAAAFGLAAPVVGVVQSFGAVDRVPPERRAAELALGIERATTWGSLATLAGLAVGAAAIALFVARGRRLRSLAGRR